MLHTCILAEAADRLRFFCTDYRVFVSSKWIDTEDEVEQDHREEDHVWQQSCVLRA